MTELAQNANRWKAIALLAVVYYFSARWSLLLAFEDSNASPIWPPSGIALGAMLLFGRRVWPGLIIGAFAANLVTFEANQVVAGPAAILVSLSIACGNTLEALFGFCLLRYLRITDAPLNEPQSVFKFMVVALTMCLVAASIGVASLVLGHIVPLAVKWPVWLNWWLGDIGGILIVTPLMLTWLSKPPRALPPSLRPSVAVVASFAAFALISGLIFSGDFSNEHADRLLVYLHMPLLAWIAFRFGQRGVSIASLLLSGIAIMGTVHGLGPFATGNLNNSLILLVTFIVLCCVTGQILAADINQRASFKSTPPTLAELKLPWLTLLAALGLTVMIWHTVSSETEKTAREEFGKMADGIRQDIHERLTDYEQILRGGVALFNASKEVSRDEWRHYAEQLNIQRGFPGIQSFAYAAWVTPQQKHNFEARNRAEGYPNFRIQPAGDREAYVPVTYIEPFDWRNQRAFGFDMYSESVRHEAILHARESGNATISGKVRLAQENGDHDQAGFVMYVPIYRNGMPIATADQRRVALQGFVSSAFRMDDLMAGLLGNRTTPLRLEIFDGDEIHPESRMYASEDEHASPKSQPFEIELPLQTSDHAWTLRFTALPEFESQIDRGKAQIILVAGISLSLLLFILVRSLAITRETALALASNMTTALRESEAAQRTLNSRMELAAEAGGIGVWDWDLLSNIVTWDTRMYEMYQIDPAEAVDNDVIWRQRVHPDDYRRAASELEAAARGGRDYVSEYRIVLPDGNIRIIRANALVVNEEHGRPAHMIGTNVDITDLRQAEESLRASEKRFRSIYEHSPIGMALISLDGHWLDVNQAICNIVGYSKQELAGLNFQDITHPDDVKADLEHVDALLAGDLLSYNMEKRYIRKDGDLVWVLLTVTLMRDETGAPQYFVAQIKDITERIQATTKLQATLALQSAILSSSNMSMIATDTEGRVVSFNRAAQHMLQYSPDEVIGYSITALIHDAHELDMRTEALSLELHRTVGPGFETLTAKARAGLQDAHEWTYIRKDGTRLPVLLEITAIRDAQGEVTGFLGIASDITDRKQKEQAIAAALSEKEILLKEVYHRVKNNLQVITSLLNLQQRSLTEGAARSALKEAAERVRAMALVHEKLYRSEDLSSIALDEYIGDMCRQLGALAAAKERGIEIRTELDPVELGLEQAVPVGLLLNELISNCLKHGFPNGRTGEISIRLEHLAEPARHVRLEISDNGIGLPADLSIPTTVSLGLKLVTTLASQIDGIFKLESRNGTHASLVFSLEGPERPHAPEGAERS